MRTLFVMFGILFALSFASQTVHACSCGSANAPCISFGSAQAVFVGTVLSKRVDEQTRPTDRGNINRNPIGFRFAVEQSYRGAAGPEIEIFTGRGGGDCGYDFKIGQRYLVYAYLDGDKLTTYICTSTKLFGTAAEDLAFLATLSSPSQGVTIFGTITHGEAETEYSSSDIFITIEGASPLQKIRPDAEGGFRVGGLPAGKYKVTLHLPDTLSAWQSEQQIEVLDRGCAFIGWNVRNNGRVSGRVLNTGGEGVARIAVQLIKPDVDPLQAIGLGRATDASGNFSLSEVPKGRYIISVNYNRYPNPNDPTIIYPPSFYPGVVDQEQAQVITVGTGEKLENLEIRLSPTRAVSVLTGVIVWSDGSPVVDAQLSVMDVTRNDPSGFFAVNVDREGKFRINGYIGQKLFMEARSYRQEITELSGKTRITLEQAEATVQIVIPKLR
jgi:hypothetical protein